MTVDVQKLTAHLTSFSTVGRRNVCVLRADACTAAAADCLCFCVFAPATINASAPSSMSLDRLGSLGWGDVKDRTHSVPCTLLHSSVSSSFFGPKSYKQKCEFLQEVVS